MHSWRKYPLACALVCVASPLLAASAADEADLLDLSVEQLLNTEVMTASRRSQAAGLVPAPLYVITQADIRRSGASSIPELLRAVPGLHVAQIDANKWAVGARGFSRRFSNKLLIMMDGRPVYSPLFSGVFWDTQDTDLDSIERIEVVSGPGATLWGPNAVSGVINIITRFAHKSHASAAQARIDAEGSASVQGHLAGEFADGVAGRLFVKRSGLSGNDSMLGVAGDESEYMRFGGRLDGDLASGSWSLAVEGYDGESGSLASLISIAPLAIRPTFVVDEIAGGFVNARWSRTDTHGRELAVSLFFERSERDSYFFDEVRDTAQVELQHSLAELGNHSLMWGVSYRTSEDCVVAEIPSVVTRQRETVNVAGVFLQDEFDFAPDRWTLVAGAKMEYESLTDSAHFEPNVRLRFLPTESTMLWASVARAVGMPSRGERDAVLYGPYLAPNSEFNPTPYPGVAVVAGNESIRAEQGDTAELGARWHSAAAQVRVEPTLYYTEYRNLTTATPGAPVCMPSGQPLGPLGCPGPAYLFFPSDLSSRGGARGYGVELATEWWPLDRLRLVGNYSFQRTEGRDGVNASNFASAAPEHQAYVRASIDLSRAFTLDLYGRYVDRNAFTGIDSFVTADARVAWAPVPSVEIALVGNNLFDPEHVEYVSEIGDLVPVMIERRAALELRVRF